jgi:hypothetical protein
MMIEPYFQIFTDGCPVHYYYEGGETVRHSWGCGRRLDHHKKGLKRCIRWRTLRGQIWGSPGAEDEWFVGVFGDVIMHHRRGAENGFNGSDFAVNDLYVRQNKMTYSAEPTGQLPPMRADFTRRIPAQSGRQLTWSSSRLAYSGTRRNGQEEDWATSKAADYIKY